MPEAQQPPKESLLDRLMTVGMWGAAVFAAAFILWLVVVLVLWGLGVIDIP